MMTIRIPPPIGLLAAAICIAPIVAARGDSADLFRTIAPVFQSPRCMNCHTTTSFPRQGDDRHRHSMNVARGRDGHGASGLHCATCHQRTNQVASGVPGTDEDWHLAPLSMGWEGLTAGQLCRHLLDPTRNGGRTGAAVVQHLSTNLVLWAWTPGTTSRGEARRAPPMDHAEFTRLAGQWVATGAKCPD